MARGLTPRCIPQERFTEPFIDNQRNVNLRHMKTKKKDQNLNKVLPPIRCTEKEKSLIVQRATQSGLSLSEYVRKMATKGKVVIRKSTMDFETVYQLKKIGVNLNQQTRALNSTGAIPYELKAVWRKLDSLLEQMVNKP